MKLLQWIQSLLFWFLLGPSEISAVSKNGRAWAGRERVRRAQRNAPEIQNNHQRRIQQGNKNKQVPLTNQGTTPSPSSFQQQPPPPPPPSSNQPQAQAPPSVAPVLGIGGTTVPTNTGMANTNGGSNSISSNNTATGGGTDNSIAPTDHNTTTATTDTTTSTGSANVELEQACRAVDLGRPLRTNNTVTVTYTFELNTVNAAAAAAATTTATSPDAADAVNAAVADYLIQQYITPFCNKKTNRRKAMVITTRSNTFRTLQSSIFAAGDVRGVSREKSTLVQPCSTTTSTTTECVSSWQSSNTISFAPDYMIAAHNAETQILTDVSAAFAAGNITALAQQQQQSPNGGSGGANSNTNSNVTGTTYVSGSTKVSSATSSAQNASSSQGMSPAGKFFLTLFILLLVAAVVGYTVYKCGWYGKFREYYWRRTHFATSSEKRTTTPRTQQSRPFSDQSLVMSDDYDDEASTSKPQDGDYVLGTKDSFFKEDRNMFTTTTASTDDFGTEMILNDLKKDEDLFPTNASEFCRYAPTDLPLQQERERPTKPSTNDDNNNGTTTADNNYNFSLTADAINLSDIDIVVDDGSLEESLSPLYLQAAKRAYSVPDTVNL